MAYKNILVAIDLSPESNILMEKAVSMAKPYQANLSLIHVGMNYSDLYTGLVDINMNEMNERITEDTHTALKKLADQAGYPITHTLSGNGEFGQILIEAIQQYNIDLVVCGHHQDFWSKLMSAARQLINTTHIDTLIVPLKDSHED